MSTPFVKVADDNTVIIYDATYHFGDSRTHRHEKVGSVSSRPFRTTCLHFIGVRPVTCVRTLSTWASHAQMAREAEAPMRSAPAAIIASASSLV